MCKTEYLEKLIEKDKDLIDHSMCMEMATKYGLNKYNYSYHALIRQKANRELDNIKKEFERDGR